MSSGDGELPDGERQRDLRVMFSEGWVLAIGLFVFGAAAVVFFFEVLPRGWRGLSRFALLVVAVVLVGGVVAPIITRALLRRR